MKKTLPTLILLTLVTAAARAQDPSPPPMWPVDAIKITPVSSSPTTQTRDLVRRLTSPDFPTREAASRELTTKGFDAFPGLNEIVTASKDPELLARTADCIGPGHFHVPSGVPANVAKLVRGYEASRKDAQHYLDTIGNVGPGPGGDQTADRLLPSSMASTDDSALLLFYQIVLDQETSDVFRHILTSQIQKYVPLQARYLIASGKLDAAQAILHDAITTRPEIAADYVALVALRQGASFDPQQELQRLPPNTSPQVRAMMGVLLFRAKGDVARAADFSLQVDNQFAAPARLSLIQTGRFDELDKYAQMPNHSNYFDAITVARLLRRDDAIEQIVARNGQQPATPPSDIVPILSALNYYLSADRAQTAITLAKTWNGFQPCAFLLLCQQLRIREALATIPNRKTASIMMVRQLNDLQLFSEARKLLADIKPDVITLDSSRGYADAFMYAAELDHAGSHQEAAQWRSRIFPLIDPDVTAFQTLDVRLNQLAEQVKQLTDQMPKPGTPPGPADQIAARMDLRRRIGLVTQDQTALSRQRDQLKPCLAFASLWYNPDLPDEAAWREASWWYENVLWNEPLDTAKRYDKAVRLVSGALTDAEAQTFADQCLAFVSKYSSDTKAALAAHWTTALHHMNRDVDAEILVARLVAQDDDTYCWSLLGDIDLEKKDFPGAAKRYLQAATLHPSDASLMYRLGLALSGGQTDPDAGRQLMAYAPFLALGDRNQLFAFIKAKRSFEGDARANEWSDHYINRFTNYADSDFGEVIARARDDSLSKGDFSAALNLATQALFFSRPHSTFTSSWIMANLADYHKCRALDALQRHDLPTLIDALNRQLDNGPPDPDLLEKTLPALQSAPAPSPAAAQKILTRAHDRLKPIVEDYPEAPQYKDQLTRLQKLLP